MAILFRIACSNCGELVVYRGKEYRHARVGIKFDHKVESVTSTKLTDSL